MDKQKRWLGVLPVSLYFAVATLTHVAGGTFNNSLWTVFAAAVWTLYLITGLARLRSVALWLPCIFWVMLAVSIVDLIAATGTFRVVAFVVGTTVAGGALPLSIMGEEQPRRTLTSED